MMLKFFGVRGSYPVSGKRYRQYGGHTPSILIEEKNTIIIFDAGTGIIEVGNYIASKKGSPEINIFLSHFHYDHIQGLPFFKPFFNKKPKKINIYGPVFTGKKLEQQLEVFFDCPFVPFSLDNIKRENNIIFKSYESSKFKVQINDEVIVKGEFNTNHPKNGVYMLSAFIKDKKIAYITDINLRDNILEQTLNFAKDSDILIFDSFFTDLEKKLLPEIVNYGHSSFEDAIKIKELSNSKSLYFFHFNPICDDKELNKLEKIYCKKDIQMATEGLEVKL